MNIVVNQPPLSNTSILDLNVNGCPSRTNHVSSKRTLKKAQKAAKTTSTPTDGHPQIVGRPTPYRWGSWVEAES